MENDASAHATDTSKPLVVAVSATVAFLLLVVVIMFCVIRRKREAKAPREGTLLRPVAHPQPERGAETGNDVRVATLSVTSDTNPYENVEVCPDQKRRQYISMHMRTTDYTPMSKGTKRSGKSKYKSRSCVVSSQSRDRDRELDPEPIYLNTRFTPVKEKRKEPSDEDENPYIN